MSKGRRNEELLTRRILASKLDDLQVSHEEGFPAETKPEIMRSLGRRGITIECSKRNRRHPGS